MYTVEKIEKDYIILEDRKTYELIDVKKDYLPDNIKEGDIIDLVSGKYIINNQLTKDKKKNLRNKFNSLLN